MEDAIKKITAVAPMRADLAGGTLDIYPLHVFMGGALSINAALTLTSEVVLEPANGPAVRIISKDLDVEQSAPDAAQLDPNGALGFLARIVKFYAPPGRGLTLRTRNNVPKGSGLGASSTLLIAASHALNTWLGGQRDPETIIHTGLNIEAEFMQVPAGKQDYYSATYGGVSAIHFYHDANVHEHVITDESFLDELDARLIISFAGAPRFSGASNWNMFKSYIDGDPDARRNLDNIKRIAHDMLSALRSRDLDAFTQLLQEEWEHRRNIADGVSTPEIETMMAAASAAGARASKVCGAGGGGCMVTVADPDKRNAVCDALFNAGATVMDCKISRQGVVVNVE